MYGKIRKLAIVLVAVLALVFSWQMLVTAQAITGEGPFDAMAPTGEWMNLEAGDTHWYVIHYDYVEDVASEPLEIKMFAEPYASATLTVRNRAQVDEWIRDGEKSHFGCCTMADTDRNGDGLHDFAQWAGALRESGDYYLVVEHAENVDEAANYRFTVSGQNISFPIQAEALEGTNPVQDAAGAMLVSAEPGDLAGSAPDFALAPTDAWTELATGQYHWYAFDFDYEKDIEEPVQIRLYAEPAESSTLTVRNADQAQLWRDDGEHVHFGCATPVNVDMDLDGNADYSNWSGSLHESGRYYAVLEHAEGLAEPSYYRFTIGGKNLSFPLLVDAPMTMAAPPPEKPAADLIPMAEIDLAGSGPDFALEPTGEWMELHAGDYHWYKFTYDEDADWTTPMTIRLFTEPIDTAMLTVRNGEQAELWRLEGEHQHFGCCVRPEVTSQTKAKDDDEDGLVRVTEKLDYAIWSADLTESGVYYIVVEHAKNSSEPAYYRFDVEGDGLRL